MYLLKQQPEDFVVREISKIEFKDKGKFIYCKLIKKNRNGLDVIREIAKQLHIQEKQIGFAGNKDKQAVTEQLISIPAISQEKIKSLDIDQVSVEFAGYGDKSISLGDLQENYFEIVVRNLEKKSVNKIDYLENYFDEQRFSKNNVDIGKSLVKKQFTDAVKLISNKEVNEHLAKYNHDSVGALKKLSVRLLRMYVNAYQSYLWNEILAKYLKKKGKFVAEISYSLGTLVFVSDLERFIDLKVPLIGFGSGDIKLDKEVAEIVNELMRKEGINYSDFVIKQIPELTLEGELRKAFVEVKNLKIGKEENDELNAGKKKIKLKFSLGKGSYATMAVRKIISCSPDKCP